MMIQQLNTTEGRDGNGAERYYHSDRGDDDAEGQRRSDGYTFSMLSVCALRSGRVSGLVPRTLCIMSCTSRSLTDCICECLHELCVSYINVLNDKCIGECGSTNCEEWIGYYYYHHHQIKKFWD